MSSTAKSTIEVPLIPDLPMGRMIVGQGSASRGHILHCNYYNTYLQRTIWKDAGNFLDARPILVGAAAEQSYWQLSGLFEQLDLSSIEDRKKFATHFYSWSGFGALDLSPMTIDGGTIVSDSQHYAEGWKAQFGRSSEPVGLMTQGWLAGAVEAIFSLKRGVLRPGQAECGAVTGGARSVFILEPKDCDYHLYQGAGIGELNNPPLVEHLMADNINEGAVKEAVLRLPLFGHPNIDSGLIKNFDVLISWHPHQYYDRVSFECLHEAMEKFGDEGRFAIEPLLEEAGHRCAFRTFGGIWRSMEWAAVVEPMCRTREDWVHGMVAVINCAGWGNVRCTDLSPDGATFIVSNDYECTGYSQLYGKPTFAPTYLLRGGFRGMMNLVFNGDILSKPMLTEALYESLHRRPDAFEVEVVGCKALGGPESVYRVFRKRP